MNEYKYNLNQQIRYIERILKDYSLETIAIVSAMYVIITIGG